MHLRVVILQISTYILLKSRILKKAITYLFLGIYLKRGECYGQKKET